MKKQMSFPRRRESIYAKPKLFKKIFNANEREKNNLLPDLSMDSRLRGNDRCVGWASQKTLSQPTLST
jgi:hypothetical protein